MMPQPSEFPIAVRPEEPSLYAGLLGPAWEELPPLVRRLHREGRATGHFTIHRARGVLPALIGWLCRFPRAGEDVPTRLLVRREETGQSWERTFGTDALATTQRDCGEGRLAERLGPVECVFRLRAESRSLVYTQVAAWLCLGPWRLTLPRLFAPHIEAETTEVPTGMHVHVRIGSGLLGGLLSYEGIVVPEESP